jgi:hypothetical protein
LRQVHGSWWQHSDEGHHERWGGAQDGVWCLVAEPLQVQQQRNGMGKLPKQQRKESKRQRRQSGKCSKWKDFCDDGKDSDSDAEEEVQESSSGASGSAPLTAKKEEQHAKSLMCCDCEEPGCRLTLATLGSRDWQGTLVCICRDCYNKSPRPLPKIEVSSALSGDGASRGKQRAAKHREFFWTSRSSSTGAGICARRTQGVPAGC